MSGFCIVLVHPRDPNNIGAVARAMRNFGLSDLRVVAPYAPVWDEAVSAVGADIILKQAQLADTVSHAVADCTFSLAATALKNREIKQEIIFLPQLANALSARGADQTALVFGNEKTGLSNEDISLCDAVLNIPTSAEQPSLNLAQAVVLTCYELARAANFKPLRLPKERSAPTLAQKELFVQEADSLCVRAGFKADLSSAQRQSLLRQILSRQNLTQEELFFLKTLIGKLK